MKKSLIHLAGAILLAFALSTGAKADPINGTIQFSGLVKFDTNSPATATTATFVSLFVLDADGDLASTIGQTVTFTPTWTLGSTGFTLWTVNGFSFNVVTSQILPGGTGVDPSTHQPWIQVASTGTLTSANPLFDATPAIFNFSSEGPGTGTKTSLRFSFSGHAETQAVPSVPDGGTTALLVGLGLVGMSVIARRRK